MKWITKFFKKAQDYDTVANTPEKRVNAFISHWYEHWSIARKKMGKEIIFEYWGKLISQVDDAHFVSGRSSDSRNWFSSAPEYTPRYEKIKECDIQDNNAQVFTEKYNPTLKSYTYHVFELQCCTNGNWLISKIYTLCHPPKSSVIDLSKHHEILEASSIDSPLIQGEHNLNLNENILFQSDRDADLPNLGQSTVNLEVIGKLNVTSGVIGILDFGYDIYDFAPLNRKIHSGEYTVETVTAFDRIAGVRVRLSETDTPVKWYAANTAQGNGVYGVDAGNLAIVDVDGLLSLSRIDKEKLFNEWRITNKPQLLSMTNTNDCLITTSGFGDGAYPAFWGVNEADQIVSLYIDFMVLVEDSGNGLYVSI